MTLYLPTVFIVDDEDQIRTTLSRALEKRGYAVQVFNSAETFLESYDREQPGCLLLDYAMPGMNGLQLQQRLSDAGIRIPIVFISGHGGVPETVQAMKGGAINFIEKPFRQAELLSSIEEAFDRDEDMRAKLDESRKAQARFDRLTSREKEIADRMVAHPSETASKQIGRALDISPRTVDHHRARILEKLEITSIAELIDLAKRMEEVES